MFRSTRVFEAYYLPPFPALSSDTELLAWIEAVQSNGGTFAADSISIASGLIDAIQAASYGSKIVYLLPLLGSNLAAALVPLRDSLSAGVAGNTAFVNGDFTQATGLQGNGTTKILDTHLYPSSIGAGGNGGMGWWENNINFSGTPADAEPNGCYATNIDRRFALGLRAGASLFVWGNAANSCAQISAAVNAHYYGQRSSATSRKLYKNGSNTATNTTSDSPSGMSDNTMRAVGCEESNGAGTLIPAYWAGRCACCYFTDGTMSDPDIADFNTLLGTYLITPTGR